MSASGGDVPSTLTRVIVTIVLTALAPVVGTGVLLLGATIWAIRHRWQLAP